MNLCLLQGVRARYRDWKYIIDGDGGDENLKHSLTYSGGLSRGYTRNYATSES